MAKGLHIETPNEGYTRFVPFNRFAVERIDVFAVMHFGFLKDSALLDHYSCAITAAELEVLKESLMDYLGRTGPLGDAPPHWPGPGALTKHFGLCNFIGVCGGGEIAEITLNNFVSRAASTMATSGKTLRAQPIALLKSSIGVHKHWIRALYTP